jgi:hypothetical protein
MQHSATENAAGFSSCRRYRYWLTRTWDRRKGCLCWVLLNPSTADERRDDPTIRRCLGFGRSLGYGAVHVVNLFALCATRPKQLREADEPIGAENDRFIIRAARDAGRVMAAWGCHGAYRGRDQVVVALLARIGVPLACLGMTKAGRPRHPLYVPSDAQPVPFTAHASDCL